MFFWFVLPQTVILRWVQGNKNYNQCI
jgi:hypothetical protein